MQSPWWDSFKVAICFAPAGVLSAVFVLSFSSSDARGEGWAELPLYAGAAVFLTVLIVWWLHVARPGKAGVVRGAVAGLIIGLVAHPVTWYMWICSNWVLISLSIRSGPSAGGEPLNPLTGMPGAFVFSLWSVMLIGWLTVPAAAVAGALFGGWQRRSLKGKT